MSYKTEFPAEFHANVLVGCERSGVVREAFRARGHNAWSCDIEPADDGSPWHMQGNVIDVLRRGWDLAILHPPCTYLCGSGLHWNRRRPERAELTERALEFARLCLDAPVARVAVENPVGLIGSRIRPADQWIQPYQFGDDASKLTGLWLRGLPKLVSLHHVHHVPGRLVCRSCGLVHRGEAAVIASAKGCECGADCNRLVPRWANQTDSGQNRLGPSPDRARLRSQTYPGIARAMAEQWG